MRGAKGNVIDRSTIEIRKCIGCDTTTDEQAIRRVGDKYRWWGANQEIPTRRGIGASVECTVLEVLEALGPKRERHLIPPWGKRARRRIGDRTQQNHHLAVRPNLHPEWWCRIGTRSVPVFEQGLHTTGRRIWFDEELNGTAGFDGVHDDLRVGHFEDIRRPIERICQTRQPHGAAGRRFQSSDTNTITRCSIRKALNAGTSCNRIW